MKIKFDDKKIKEILVKDAYVGEEDLKKSEEYAASNHTYFLDYLLSESVINKTIAGQVIAKSFGVEYVDLNANQLDKELILHLPEALARKYRAVITNESKSDVVVTTDDPAQEGLAKDVKKVLQKEVGVAYSFTADIDTILLYYTKPLETRFQKIIESSEHIAPEILDEIFSDALTLHASDIHFEPRAKEVEVRFRVDGVLYLAGVLPKQYYPNILNRLKILAHSRIDEHDAAQDGSLRFEKDDLAADMRSSIIPTIDGEKVVLRILMSYVQGFGLTDLGLSAKHQLLIESAIKKPFGMIITTGPTGSGKTTTLYSFIKNMNRPGINITTIEDPVEYKIEGINQIQVNPAVDLTFATGLKSIVRQDPDVILIGEIRDRETADTAVNAALTGHLLFSTFHANDAATAIPRLLDMKVEPFLAASTIVLIISQKLVRKLCTQCRTTTEVARKTFLKKYPTMEHYFAGDKITLLESVGCSACNNTGFKGRSGIFEIINVTPEMHDLILQSPSSQEIWALARKQGSSPLFEDGIEKVMSGVTTLDELLRVAEPPDAVAASSEKSPKKRKSAG
jgi:type IV pilus assembly protein PilB